MKAIVKKTVKTRNGGRKTVSEEMVGSKPISKKETVPNQRPDYNAKPISKENRAKGIATMNKIGNNVKQVVKATVSEKMVDVSGSAERSKESSMGGIKTVKNRKGR